MRFRRFYRNPSGICSCVTILLFLISSKNFSQAPNWSFANRAGGTSEDWALSVSADPFGNCYATGHFYSPTITLGPTTLTNAGLTDVYVVKYGPAGNILWVRQIGNTGSE